MKPFGFVLLSGGIDSSTCLAFARRDCGRENVIALSVDYGQRHSKEMEQARAVVEYMLGNVEEHHKILTIEGMPKAGLTDHDAAIPDVSYAELKGVSPTYVPFRNGQLLSKAAAFASDAIQRLNEWAKKSAENQLSAGARVNPWNPEEGYQGILYFGAHAEDAAGDAYPDCRLDFVGAMAAAILIGTYRQVEVRAPIIQMYKDEIVTAGHKLGVPWHLTWSCYKGEELHCGTCPTCRARKDGFRKAGVKDPTVYRDPTGQFYG